MALNTRIADQASEVIIAFDNDEAGERGAKDLAECLAEHGVQAYRLRPPRAVVDVNDWRMQTGSDWTTQLRRTVGGLAKRTPTPSLILG